MHKLSSSFALLAGVSAISIIALPASAAAQSAASASNAAPQPSADAGGVEDIVVTAQRRNERQQDVPIAISTVTSTAAAKQGIMGTEALGRAVPSLQFSRQTGNGGTPFIRGVGTTQAALGAESPVAVYVDDVYIGAPSASLLKFNSIDSIEVLKGPQGTLFGRNATGGVVNIHTRRPTQEFAMDASVGYGRFNTYSGNLYLTSGLAENLAANFAATGEKQKDGYGRDLISGRDTLKGWNYGFRSQLLWENSDTSILLSGDYNRSKSDFGMSVVVAPGTVAQGGGRFVEKYGTYDTPGDFSRSTVWGVSGKLNHDFGPFSVVWITAYRNNRLDYRLDADSSPTGAVVVQPTYDGARTKVFSQEVQLLSPTDQPFRWIVGAYYLNSNASYNPLRFIGAAFAGLGGARVIESSQDLDSYAAFGEASYEFLPETRLTVGARYTTDKYDFRVTELTNAGVVRPGTPTGDKSSFSKATYRAILDHKFSPGVMAYASYSRGFKSGGYNLSAPTVTRSGVLFTSPVVSPEVLDAYEIGVKSDLFDRKLRVNVAAYRYDYSNLQVTSIQNSTSITLNAASARIKGIDVDTNFVPNRYLSFGAGFAYLDSKFSRFPNGPLFVPQPAVCTPTPTTTGPLTGGNLTCVADLAGNRTSRSPKFVMNLNATVTIPTSVGDFAINGNLYHNSGFFWEPDNRFKQPKYDLLGAHVTWTSLDKKFEFQVYGRNLLNKYYYSYFSEATGRDSGSPEMPRTYGATATVHF